MPCTRSGDGTLCAYNLKKGKLILRSDQLEDELLSVEIIKVRARVEAVRAPVTIASRAHTHRDTGTSSR